MDRVTFRCRLSGPATPLPHFWEHTVGSCHAPLVLRADWQEQLGRCHDELGFRHVRFHGLLCDDLGTLVTYKDRLVYSFFNADSIIDYLLSIGMRPFVELSFMPQALASKPTTVFHYRANVTPPRDYGQWALLIGKLVSHWVERYGAEEVRAWFFEVWNEPNLARFWDGTRDEYLKLYQATVRTIKSVDGCLRVGGPASANNDWLGEFLDYCAANRLPADFVSTHHYPNDVPGYEDADTDTQLAHGRRSMLREWTQQARGQARGLPLYYTEWNTSSDARDPRHDEPYAAAFVIKTVMEANGLVDAYSWWAFTDIFEEDYFPSVPFHGGFGLLNLHGIAKPTYRAFQLLHRLGTEAVAVEPVHETVDAWVIKDGASVAVLLSNHALPRHPIRPQQVRVLLEDAPQPRAASIERIDENHANAKRLWIQMGEPEYLNAEEVGRLQRASALVKEDQPWQSQGGGIQLECDLPPHGVAAITVQFAP
ncbi:MAG TPA: glycosyl hydrolase [Gemmataceae bacterium]|jgi:xylan 1,4-beta-xylosidase|nr:glycosyl hydrolase [Gemmataceae bacterium]